MGEHEVIFAGTDEVISLKHEAFSKAVFAKGAVQAAKFLKGKGKGTVYYAGCNRLNSMIKRTYRGCQSIPYMFSLETNIRSRILR